MKSSDRTARVNALWQRLSLLQSKLRSLRVSTSESAEMRVAWVVFHALGGDRVRLRRFVHALAAAPSIHDAAIPSAPPVTPAAAAQSTATRVRVLLQRAEVDGPTDARLAQTVRAALAGDHRRLTLVVDELAKLGTW